MDPLGIAAEQVMVPEGLMPVFGLFDGVRTTAEIQRTLEESHGGAVPPGLVAKLVQQLDEHLMLLSPRFENALQRAASEFAAQPLRPASHAGSAGYPDEPGPLREALDSMVRRSTGPLRAAPRGLVAPHIDLARGREGYAQAYGYLAECEPADLYVVFGTGHQGPSAPVTGLAMDWSTPLGTVPTHRGFVEAVHRRIGGPSALDVFLHQGEHSLEFQMLFLRHVMDDHPFQVAGFLTGGLGAEPAEDEAMQRVVQALEDEAAATGLTVCYIAGADLAHVGPVFGDAEPVEQGRLDRLTEVERAKLAYLEGGDAVAFYGSVEANGNPDRVCGTTPMYLTARLAGGPGQLLHYGQAPAADGSQVVSFCAMAFEG